MYDCSWWAPQLIDLPRVGRSNTFYSGQVLNNLSSEKNWPPITLVGASESAIAVGTKRYRDLFRGKIVPQSVYSAARAHSGAACKTSWPT